MPEPSLTVKDGDVGAVVSRRQFLIGATLAAASGIAFARQPVPIHPVIDKERFRGLIPKVVGSWQMDAVSGVVLPPQDDLSDRLYDNLVTRIYAAPDRPAIMLLLAYNNIQDGVLQVHRPETCYHVGGFALSDPRKAGIPISGKTIPASFFKAASPNRVEQVGYFTRVGSLFPDSWAAQRIAVARANLAQEVPDALMMRVSLIGSDQGEAITILSDFCQQFYSAANPGLQRLLIGQTA